MCFLLIFPVSHHPLLFDAPLLFSRSAPLSTSAPLIPPPSLMSSRPNSLHISFPPLHLAPSLVLSPWPIQSNPFSSSRADSAAGFGAHTRLCQVGTGDAAGCTLTRLCPFRSNSHQVCLRCCLFSFRLLSSLYELHRQIEAGEVFTTVNNICILYIFVSCCLICILQYVRTS